MEDKELTLIEDENKEEEKTITTSQGDTYTEKEWETPIFEGGPTRKEIEEWKDTYGEIFYTPISGKNYIWRNLFRPEYREIIKNQDLTALDREEIVSETCVLFPLDYSSVSQEKRQAGVPSILMEMIMTKSGFAAETAPIKL